MQLVRLVGHDDIPVVHHASPPPDQRHCGVGAAGDQGQGATPGPDPPAERHISVLIHSHVIDGVVVGGVGAHAAPADWGRAAS